MKVEKEYWLNRKRECIMIDEKTIMTKSISDVKASTEGVFISKEDAEELHKYFQDEYIKFAAKEMHLNDVYQETEDITELVEEIKHNHFSMIDNKRRAQLFGKIDKEYCESAIYSVYLHNAW